MFPVLIGKVLTFLIPATVSAGMPQDTCVAVGGLVAAVFVTNTFWHRVGPSVTTLSVAVMLKPLPVSTIVWTAAKPTVNGRQCCSHHCKVLLVLL